jgi:glycine hydroxymethyltransferase
VIENAQALARTLALEGLRVVSGGTDNHIILLDVFGSFGITGKEAEKALESVGISTNKNMIPFDSRKPLDPSGIRIGTPAITTRGMRTREMEILGNIIVRTLKNRENINELELIRSEVKKLCQQFPLYRDIHK